MPDTNPIKMRVATRVAAEDALGVLGIGGHLACCGRALEMTYG